MSPRRVYKARSREHLRLLEGEQQGRGTRVIGYVRVSDYKHGDGLSPEVQLREIKLYCAREGLVLVAVLGLTETADGSPVVMDLDLSGRTSKKRKIKPMIDAIRRDEADGVVVWKISRWGRNTLDALGNIRELHTAGGFILSTSENLNEIDTAIGRFTLTQYLAIAQLQSDQIGEVWANIREYRWSKGVPATGGERWGYQWNREVDWAERPEQLYTIKKEMVDGVTMLYRLYISGLSFSKIVDYSRNHGINAANGKPFTEGTLRQTMDTGFAAALLVRYPRDRRTGAIRGAHPESNDYLPGAHEPILERELWDEYVECRSQRSALESNKTGTTRCSGLLQCHCGAGMSITQAGRKKANGDVYKYFRCTHSRQTRLPEHLWCLEPAQIAVPVAEAKVLDWLVETTTSDERKAAMAQARAHAGEKAVDNSKELAARITRIKGMRSKAYRRLLEAEDADEELYRVEDDRMKTEIEELETQLRALGTKITAVKRPVVPAMRALIEGWEGTPETVNAALARVIHHVEVKTYGRGGAPAEVKVVSWEEWEVEGQGLPESA